MSVRWLLALPLLWVACGDDTTPAGPGVRTGGDAGTSRECYDPDEDGFGPNCALGADCDNDNPDDTDLCYRCAKPHQFCPCEPGTEPEFCKPEDEKVEGGLIVCSEGTLYCRDGAWSGCERIAQYTMFIPDP